MSLIYYITFRNEKSYDMNALNGMGCIQTSHPRAPAEVNARGGYHATFVSFHTRHRRIVLLFLEHNGWLDL
jgi:hypothetical protein